MLNRSGPSIEPWELQTKVLEIDYEYCLFLRFDYVFLNMNKRK